MATSTRWHDSSSPYRVWLGQIIDDLKRLTNRGSGWRIVAQTARVRQPFGLAVVADDPPNVPRMPLTNAEWLRTLIAEGHDPVLFLFELLCAYRCPFDRGESPINSLDNPMFVRWGEDVWEEWTRKAAEGLFARPGWVRFTHHLFNPMSLYYHANQELHADLAAEVWCELIGGDFQMNRRRWSDCKANAEWQQPAARKSFFDKVGYADLGFPQPPESRQERLDRMKRGHESWTRGPR